MCQHTECREAAHEAAAENFEADKGFSLYDLPIGYTEDAINETVTWETITRATSFQAADRYFWTVADMYLSEGMVSCTQY